MVKVDYLKKLLAVLLSLLMVFQSINFIAFAEEEPTGDKSLTISITNVYGQYRKGDIEEGFFTVKVTGADTGVERTVTLPAMVDGELVWEIELTNLPEDTYTVEETLTEENSYYDFSVSYAIDDNVALDTNVIDLRYYDFMGIENSLYGIYEVEIVKDVTGDLSEEDFDEDSIRIFVRKGKGASIKSLPTRVEDELSWVLNETFVVADTSSDQGYGVNEWGEPEVEGYKVEAWGDLYSEEGDLVRHIDTPSVSFDGNEYSEGSGDYKPGKYRFVITNNYTKLVSKTVTKVWDDNDDAEGVRPESVSVQLLQNGTAYGDAVTLNEENGWQYTWDELANSDTWSVEEVSVPEGYISSVVETEDGFTITNTYSTNGLLTISKEIAGALDKTDFKAGDFTFYIWEESASEMSFPSYSVTLPVEVDGELVWETDVEIPPGTYKMKEEYAAEVEGYELEKSYSSLTRNQWTQGELFYFDIEKGTNIHSIVTNTYTASDISLSVNKVWKDNNDSKGIRPDSIEVQLYQDGEEYGSPCVLNEGNGWSYSWGSLPGGYEYTVKEVETPEWYVCKVSRSGNSFTITNSLEEIGTVGIEAIKKIKASDINFDNGNPTFLFKLVCTDGFDEGRTYYKSVEFTESYVSANTDSEGYVSLGAVWDSVSEGKYSLIEDEVSRYYLENITSAVNGVVSDGSVLFDLTVETSGSATFINKAYDHQYFSHNDIVINHIDDNFYKVTSDDHQYYKIGSGKSVSFVIDGPYNELNSLLIDGNLVTKTGNYTVSEDGTSGDTVVTLTPDYLGELTEGDFAVEFVFNNGFSRAKLTTTYINALDLNEVSKGYITMDGVINTAIDTLSYTERIPAKAGDTFEVWHFNVGPTSSAARFITAYDAEGNVVSQHSTDYAHRYVVPEGVASVVFTLSTGSIDKVMLLRNTDHVPTRYTPFNDDASGDIDVADIVNILDLDDVETGYVTTQGVIDKSVSTLSHTRRIVVDEGDTFKLWYFTTGGTNTAFRFITAYDENGKVIEEAGVEAVKSYTVPEGVHSLVFTVSEETINNTMIVKNSDVIPPCFVPYNGNNVTLDLPDSGMVNLFNKEAITSGYMAPNGGVSSASSLCYSEKISVEEGDTLYIWNGVNRYAPRFITAFDADGNAVSEKGFSSGVPNAYVVPSGITDVIITTYTSTLDTLMVFKNTDGIPPQYIPYVEPAIPEPPEFINMFDSATVGSGYMAPNGGVSASSSLCYSKKIYVNPGDVLSFWNGTAEYSPRFITAFNSEGEALSSSGTNSPGTTYTVPDNVDSVIVTVYTSVLDKFMVFINNSKKPTSFVAYDENLIPPVEDNTESSIFEEDLTGEKYINTSGNMSANTKLSLGKADIITDKRIVFKADVTSFSGLRIGHGYEDYTANYIEIDDTSIKQYFYTSSASLQKEEAHGLTITGDIKVAIEVNNRRVAKITLISDNETYTFSTGTTWYGSNGEIFAESLGSVLPNAQLAFTCDGYSDDIQFYGDSYLSQSSDRWLYFAFNDGKSNALFDGYGGRGSGGAYTSLVNNLKYSSPKTVVWMLGMNDGSDTDINTPSTNWVTNRDKLIALAEQEGFEIVFATIPTVPNINHEAKNKWIKESGYRYIDMAAAVGADGTGAWTDGMLSTDKVHPTASGAEAIYNQVVEDFPDFK